MVNHSKSKEDNRNVRWAEQATRERLLNAYLREKGIWNPGLGPDDQSLKMLPIEIVEEMEKQGIPMKVELSDTGTVIFGSLRYFSAFGHHRYGTSWYKIDKGNVNELEECRELAAALLQELACSEPDESDRNDRVNAMLSRIENSIEKTSKYIQRSLRPGVSLWEQTGGQRFCAAEQSLIYGHPFHPTPKSSEGFSPDDLERYAPELGASFVLHYFAASPELVAECLPETTGEEMMPAKVLEAARQQLGSLRRHYRLMPCHPWQAQYLKNVAEVTELIEAGQLIDLGPLGNPVYPTSSIRTVWDPEHAYMFKLPLNVRITNFVRVNPTEQLKRTVDAGRVLARLRDEIPYSEFGVLLEAGYRTLTVPAGSEEQGGSLAESFGVIFRENPVRDSVNKKQLEGGDAPTVVAALLEQPPRANEAPVWEAVRMAAAAKRTMSDRAFLGKWLERYLEIALSPVLWLFLERGISVEAHVQNSMVTLQNGWPIRFWIRDLEGVSISRERALNDGLFGLPEDSPAFYPDEEAWNRLKYYFFVYHLGHLIHTLALYGEVDELALWQVVSEVLQTSGLFEGEERKPYLRDLLESEGLPAKANLASGFQNRGETPLYVEIPNPLIRCEVTV